MIQSLQKSHFRYSRCQLGQLHAGEMLNLVCVDEKCDHRGLICPVCKMQSHNQCHVLPVKIFLAQIRDLFASNHNPDQLNNLGGYLRTLDSTKKEMLNILKQQINELANIFREIQIKIDSTYVALRHNILIQSTLTTKLPSLLEDLLSGNSSDAPNLQKQFSKYCQLIKYREGKPKVTDKALSLVEHYKNLPGRVKNLMNNSMDDFKKKLGEISQKIVSEQNSSEQKQEKVEKPTFSDVNKNNAVQLNAQKDEAWNPLSGMNEGIICTQQTFKQVNNTFNFEVISLGEQNMLMLAVGTKQLFESWNTSNLSILQHHRHKLLALVQSDGTSSKEMDYNYDSEYPEEDQPFFFGTGQKVSVTYDQAKQAVIFKNSQLDEPYELKLKEKVEPSQMKMMVGLLYEDKVRILPSA